MRPRAFAVLIAALALAGAGVASGALRGGPLSGPSAIGGGHHDAACPTGGLPEWTVCLPSRDFSLDAHAVGGSGRAVGTLRYGHRGGPLDMTVAVSCLNVSGGHAVVGGTVTGAPDPSVVGLPALFFVTDQGDPASATPDGISAFLLTDPSTPFPGEPADFPRSCPSSTDSFMGYFDITGDVAVSG
jgi:hypothetical protein